MSKRFHHLIEEACTCQWTVYFGYIGILIIFDTVVFGFGNEVYKDIADIGSEAFKIGLEIVC